MKTLSSRWTFVQKVAFPLVWSTGFGIGTIILLVRPDVVVFNGVQGAPRGAGWLFLGLWIAGTAMLIAFGWRMKRVRLDGRDLLVSNYLRETRVPLSTVGSVTREALPFGNVVTIECPTGGEWGSKISYIAQRHPWQPKSEIREIDELARLVDDAKHADRLTG